MLYQPVIMVFPPMRCRWGKERRIGDVKGGFFEHMHQYMTIIISTVILSSVECFFIRKHANSCSPSLSGGHLVDGAPPA